jgi:hypothetical protein
LEPGCPHPGGTGLGAESRDEHRTVNIELPTSNATIRQRYNKMLIFRIVYEIVIDEIPFVIVILSGAVDYD